jgi:membrane protein DedA with SNARE-associated domain
MWLGTSLALATLVSEDATTLAAGVMVASHRLTAAEAIAWVSLGIWLGDVGLFAAGRLAGRLPPVARWVDRRWSSSQLAALSVRLDRGTGAAVFLSRFAPGSRVPLYVAAGLFRMDAATFTVWTGLASATWVTAVILGAKALGAGGWW